MADVTIDDSLSAPAYYQVLRGGPVWTSGTTGYVFYSDSGGPLKYSKTTDSGATWGTGVTVSSGGSGIGCSSYSNLMPFATPPHRSYSRRIRAPSSSGLDGLRS